MLQTLADPGFPRRWASTAELRSKNLFCKIFAENCTKMKEIGPEVDRSYGETDTKRQISKQILCHQSQFHFRK